MEKKYKVFIYENSACSDSRPTEVEDILNDLNDFELVCEEIDLYKNIVMIMEDLDEEDFYDYYDADDDFEAIIKNADWGFGDPFTYAIYCISDNEWLMGNKNSKKDLMYEYLTKEDFLDYITEAELEEFEKMI